MVAVERFLVELIKMSSKSSTSELVKWAASQNGATRWAASSQSCSEVTLCKIFFCCSQIVYSCYQSAATDGVCEQHTSHVTFSRWVTMTHVAQGSSLACAHHIPCVILMRSCCVFDSLRLSLPLLADHLLSYHPVLPPAHQLHLPRFGQIPCALQLMGTLAPLPSTTLSQVMSPTTTTSRRPLNRTSRNPQARTGPWTRMTSSTMTPPAWRSHHHCSPRSEKMMRGVDELITLTTKVCRPVSRRLSVMEQGDLLWNSLTHKFQTSEKFRATAQKVSKSGFFWNDKESRFSLTVKQRFENTISRPITTEGVFKSWMKWSSLKKEVFIVLIKETNDFDEINNFFLNNCWNKIGIFVMLMRKDGRIEAIFRLHIRHNCDEKMGRRSSYPWTHRQDSGTTEWNQLYEWFEKFSRCWISTQWTIPRCQSTSVFPTSSRSWWNAKPFSGNAEPQKWAAKYLGHTLYIGKRFANPTASSSAPYPQESNPWISNVTEDTSPHATSERQTPDTTLDPRCQSGPSARNSVIPSEVRFSKNYGADQQRLQISDPHFDKFTTPATFACWKIRFKTEVCTCSQFPTEATLWIKEVELVHSVDDLKSSCSVRGIQMPNSEALDAKIASALNRIIHNTQFKRKVSLEEQKAQKETVSFVEDRSLTWSTSTSGSLEPMILSRNMPTCLQLFFEMMIFRNSIRNGTEFHYQWRNSHLMTSWDCTN